MQDHDSTIFCPVAGDSLMGVRMMVEILDHWRDAGLTAGERDDLLIIAENANDGDRKTRGSIHAEYILRRAGKKDVSWRNSINTLMRKGVLEHAVDKYGRQIVGRLGQHAKYRIRILCPEPPHDGYKGQCTRPAEGVTPQVTQDNRVTPEVTQEGHPSGDPSNRLGHPTGDVCVTPQVTPTPLNPSTKNTPQEPPPPAAAPPDWVAPESEGVVVQEEGEGNKQDARKRADAFVDELPFLNPPTRHRKQQLQNLAAAAIAAGWSEDNLMGVCESGLNTADDRVNCWLYRLKPAVLGPAPKAGQDDPQLKPRVPKPRQPTNGHQTWQDPNPFTFGAPVGHKSHRNQDDPGAFDEKL